MSIAAPRPAATVVLLRPAASRFDVFLVQRNRRVGFMPSAWVFPGGRVDTTDADVDLDRLQGGAVAAAAMGLPDDEARPFLCAAVRETLEESGVWLGEGRPPALARDALNAGTTTLGRVLADHDLTADLDRLRPWAWWVTPEAEPRRYDTRFFVARVDDGDEILARHDDGETVASAWIPIDEAVERAETGDLPMAPPTWWTLRELAGFGDLGSIEAAARPAQPICPILRLEGRDLSLVLPGHADHPDPAIDGLPTAVGFTQGRWWAE